MKKSNNLIQLSFTLFLLFSLETQLFSSPSYKILTTGNPTNFIICNEMLIDLDEKDTIFFTYANKSKFEQGQFKNSVGEALTFNKSNYLVSIYYTYGNIVQGKKENDLPFVLMQNSFVNQLVESNYLDTINDNFYNYSNSITITPKLKLSQINLLRGKTGGISLEIGIEWYIYDVYKNLIDSVYIYDKSPFIEFGDSHKFMVSEEKAPVNEVRRYYDEPINNIAKSNLLKLIEIINAKQLYPKETLDDFSLKINKDSNFVKSELTSNVNSCVTIINKTGHGSGFIISDDGYIVTNYHVINDSEDNLNIILNNGKNYSCKIIRVSKNYDLALLKIEETGFVPLIISESENKFIGANVVAIGTPKSVQLGQTISKGIISGYRTLSNIDYLQTDVSINSGNSGGPILDSDGKVIGIVTAKLFGYGVEGIGFALPSKYIFEILGVEY